MLAAAGRVVVLSLVVLSLPQVALAGHDGCPLIPAGMDVFPSTGKLVIEPLAPPGPPFIVRLSSVGAPDTVVQRGPEDPGHTIPIELVSLELTGVAPLLGDVRVRQSPLFPSLGSISNVEKDPLPACGFLSGDSQLRVFFEVDVPGVGETWFNNTPLDLRATIHTLPPEDEQYENPFLNPVFLFDQATGTVRARVLYELHHTDPRFPPPGNDCFDTGLRNDIVLYGPGIATTMFSQGPTTVARGPSTPPPFGQIPIEIVSMELRGFDPLLGNFRVTQNPNAPSPGVAKSIQFDRTYPLDSFFDVVVQIDTQFQGSFLTQPPNPTSVRGQTGPNPYIRNIPPDIRAQYLSQTTPPAPPTPLWDITGTSVVGEISNVVHDIGEPASWEPPPDGGDDCFVSWIVIRIHVFATGCSETLMVDAPVRVLRGDPFDPGDQMEEINTLLAKIIGSGTSTCVGDFVLRLTPTQSSTGRVKSLAPRENFPADSFFDVFVTLDTAALGEIDTDGTSTRMTTTVNSLPPGDGEIYYGPGTVITLYDQFGFPVAEIEEIEHIVHRAVVCPYDCLPHLTMDPDDQTIRVSPPRGSGGGILYDLATGKYGPSSTLDWTTSFLNSSCLLDDDPLGIYSDGSLPPPGDLIWYLWRDESPDMTGEGTYNTNAPAQVGDRDLYIVSCS